MPGVVRDDGEDMAGGVLIEGSPNVYVENKPIVRIGDMVAPHGKGTHGSATMLDGSSDVYVNGMGVCREGDAANCGHVATGSSTVFAN